MRSSLLAFVLAALVAHAAHANALVFVAATTDASGAPANPQVLVSLNPQPEPPGIWTRLSTERSVPLISSVARGWNRFALTVAVHGQDGQPWRVLPPGPCRDGVISLLVYAPDGTELRLDFAVSSSMGILDPGTIRGFNPQPDPPGIGAGVTEVDFSLSTTTAVTSTTVLPVQAALTVSKNGASVPLQ